MAEAALNTRKIEGGPATLTKLPGSHQERISLCEALDRVLNKGAVLVGEVTISVADVDLIYLGLQLVVTSVDKMRQIQRSEPDDDRKEPLPRVH